MHTRTAEGTSTRCHFPGTEREWSWTVARSDLPVAHHDLSPLYRLWKAKCAAYQLPALTSFSLSDLAPWMGLLSIAHPCGGDFELELLGCSLKDQNGNECSRLPLADCKFGPVGTDAREMLDIVTGMGVIALPCGATSWRGQTFGWHGIVLPLAHSAAIVCLFVNDTTA
jgi:hypothetical protein